VQEFATALQFLSAFLVAASTVLPFPATWMGVELLLAARTIPEAKQV